MANFTVRTGSQDNVVSEHDSFATAIRVARTSGVPAWVHDSADGSFTTFNQPAKKIAKADRAPTFAKKSARKPARKMPLHDAYPCRCKMCMSGNEGLCLTGRNG